MCCLAAGNMRFWYLIGSAKLASRKEADMHGQAVDAAKSTQGLRLPVPNSNNQPNWNRNGFLCSFPQSKLPKERKMFEKKEEA